MAPQILPPLFKQVLPVGVALTLSSNEPFIIYALISNATKEATPVTLKAKGPNDAQHSFAVTLNFDSAVPGKFIHRMAARTLIL
jgi:hypothetical protein